MQFLGIDIGTGGTRALVIDETGRVLASTTAEHPPFQSPQPGWAEQNPDDWWVALTRAIRELLKARIDAKNIACIGLTGQMHGAVLLDKDERVLRPAMLWCDQRSQKQCDWLTTKIGAARLVELTANPALPNFTLTKLLWVREHEPEIWRRFSSFLLPKDYIRLKLTGVRATDVADASGTLLLDVANRRWSQPMLDAAGLIADCLPQLFESQEIAGRISDAAAAATGLCAGTSVIAGAGDQAAGAIGMGVTGAGTVSATIGTSGVVFAATDTPTLDPHGRIHTFCHAIPGRWHVMGVTQAAGLSLQWFRNTFGDKPSAGASTVTKGYDQILAEAASVPAGCDGVLWAPYLLGERTPHLDPQVRAAWVGLAANHGRGHLIRAILEGVAFSLKDSFSIFRELGVPIGTVRLGGGGARAPLWRQIQADVYGMAAEVLEAEEGAAVGAAILAGVAVGARGNIEEACENVVRVAATIQPQPKTVALLEEQYRRYRALYPALKSLFREEN